MENPIQQLKREINVIYNFLVFIEEKNWCNLHFSPLRTYEFDGVSYQLQSIKVSVKQMC